jgi:hypothetical protein
LTDPVCTTKKLYEAESEDFAFAILGLPYNSEGNTIPVQTIQPPVDYQEQFHSDLGYTGQAAEPFTHCRRRSYGCNGKRKHDKQRKPVTRVEEGSESMPGRLLEPLYLVRIGNDRG